MCSLRRGLRGKSHNSVGLVEVGQQLLTIDEFAAVRLCDRLEEKPLFFG